MSASKKNDVAAPFHVLMSSCQPQQEILKHPSIQKDYFARRFLALHGDKPQEDVWTAVLDTERAMIECCEMNQKRADETIEETVVDGSLIRGKEIQFVTLLARKCHTPSLRALGLAIIERTMEQDDWEESDRKHQIELGKEPKQEASRMSLFVAAGGLKIFNQWLIDATTPVQGGSKSISTSKESKKRKSSQLIASPTGPLLLPLLKVMKNVPFDKALITESKLNKHIRNLKKALDDAMSGKRKSDQTFRDPVAGGLVVSQVQGAVEDLMDQWKESIKSSTFAVQDPLASLKERLQERLERIQAFEAGKSDKPAFLAEFEEAERLAKERKAFTKLSSQELDERERKQERERELQIMQKKKQEAQTKVRAKMNEILKQREQLKRQRKEEPLVQLQHTRQVRWKDGYEHSDTLRQRSSLEEVFHYTKEDVEVEEQNQATAQADAMLSDDVDMDGIPLAGDEDDLWL